MDLNRLLKIADSLPRKADAAAIRAFVSRYESMRESLIEVAKRDHCRSDTGEPPIPVGLRRWEECVKIAKDELAKEAALGVGREGGGK